MAAAKRRKKTQGQPKLGIRGKLRKVQAQLNKKLEPVQRLRQRVCALNLADSAGRKTVSKTMRQECARRYPLKGGGSMSTAMPAMPGPRAMPRTMPSYQPMEPQSSLPDFYD